MLKIHSVIGNKTRNTQYVCTSRMGPAPNGLISKQDACARTAQSQTIVAVVVVAVVVAQLVYSAFECRSEQVIKPSS